MKKILITSPVPQVGLDFLKARSDFEVDLRNDRPLNKSELLNAVKGVDVLVSTVSDPVNEAVLQAAGPSLKLIAQYAVGTDNIDLVAATKHGIYVSNTPGDLTEAVAEHAIGLMFAVGRNIVSGDRYVREGNFKHFDPMLYLGPKFSGKTVGIVGMGRIGSHIARLSKNGFNMKVLYADALRNVEIEKELKASHTTLEDLLENSDVVFISCPLTKETHHLIGEKELRKMKPTAYLINIGRGPILNEEILATALKENWIEGAGLDVFEHEPAVHPDLLKLDNVVLTPHIGSATREARIQMVKMVVDNIVEVLINGKPPINLVNKDLVK